MKDKHNNQQKPAKPWPAGTIPPKPPKPKGVDARAKRTGYGKPGYSGY